LYAPSTEARGHADRHATGSSSALDFDVNRRAGAEVQALSRKLNQLADKMDDIEELVRGERLG